MEQQDLFSCLLFIYTSSRRGERGSARPLSEEREEREVLIACVKPDETVLIYCITERDELIKSLEHFRGSEVHFYHC